MTLAVGVLVRIPEHQPPQPPSETPIGRAALALAAEGQRVLLGDRLDAGVLDGFELAGDRWIRARAPIGAALDRFPSQSEPAGFARLVEGLGRRPLGNPTSLTLLCRDKVACQRRLEEAGVEMPTLAVHPDTFQEALAEWGVGFLKPRHGGLGRGVRQVVRGALLDARGPGAVPGVLDDLVLQKAVRPPPGWAGVCVRLLAQRGSDGWLLCPPVARRERADPVVNVARGAEAIPAEDVLPRATCDATLALGERVTDILGGHPHAVELGLDFVVDAHLRPHLIEVNSRPRGRLEVLAARDPGRFERAHVEACARPIRYLASLSGGSSSRTWTTRAR